MVANKGAKRDKLDILMRMLNISRTPIKRTHLLYRANLNFYQLTKYLDLLLQFNMIQEIESPFRGYRITEKGLKFLSLFEPLDLAEGRAVLVPQMGT